jgi:hypothetical protein
MGLAFVTVAVFGIYLACKAIHTFVKTYRKPPLPPDLDKDWLGKD